MKIYQVGGSVRDTLLGLPVTDRDYVVVGATPQAMLDAGYKPVGADFPVFLHPQTHEEYALARTERKTAPGYKGFVFHTSSDVTLEEDLRRRDLTINAMAFDQETDTIIDPYAGRRDLDNRVLRHVSDSFAEDPVRVLRIARFAARYAHLGFTVAPETLALMQQMVNAGEVDHLVPERVWAEFSKGLMEAKPSHLFEVLRACGALARIVPELDRLWGVAQNATHHPEIDTGVHNMMVLDTAALRRAPLEVRVACLFHDLGKGTTPADVLPKHTGHEARSAQLTQDVCARLKVPSDQRDLAVINAREHSHVHRALELGAQAVHDLFARADAWRKPERFAQMLEACECDARGRLGFEQREYPQAAYLQRLLAAAQAVQSGKIASETADKSQIPQRIREARCDAIAATIEATIAAKIAATAAAAKAAIT
jgi:tRNA nucleotidyltransferase (CCA-adding enzyme)